MRLLFLGNNWLGWQVAKWLVTQVEDQIVGLVVHPSNKRKYVEEIIDSVALDSSHIFDGARLREADTIEAIRKLNAEIAVSVLFDYILKPEFISLFPSGVINLHPALLPYNRGQYPNVWSIVENTPSGVTLHYIDADIDTGDCIAQKSVAVEATDTGASLYRKLERAGLELFQEAWPLVRAGRAPRVKQLRETGTYHRSRDVDSIDEIDLNRDYRAGELINILRARTFSPYAGAYFRDGDRRVYLRLQLLQEEELTDDRSA